jgi:hypothetical protein
MKLQFIVLVVFFHASWASAAAQLPGWRAPFNPTSYTLRAPTNTFVTGLAIARGRMTVPEEAVNAPLVLFHNGFGVGFPMIDLSCGMSIPPC